MSESRASVPAWKLFISANFKSMSSSSLLILLPLLSLLLHQTKHHRWKCAASNARFTGSSSTAISFEDVSVVWRRDLAPKSSDIISLPIFAHGRLSSWLVFTIICSSGCPCVGFPTSPYDLPLLTALAFNDVAKHDILWGELGIPFANDREEPDNVWKEHYLSLGLAYLYQTVTAATYDDRYKLISPNLGSDELFLFQGLKSQGEDDDVLVAEFSIEEEDIYLKRHLAVDKDIGPFQVWRWAYADSTKAFLYFGDGKGKLREFGYVMWDIARLAQQSLFGYHWDRYPGPIVRRQEYDRLNREMQNSFRERSKVWQRGGRGWWSSGDESRVQWPRQVVERKKNDSNRSWGKKDT